MKSDKAAVRRVPQQQRSRQKVLTIQTTAMKLFEQSGMDQVSMREIAREAELPIATVYQYFPNKQAIVRQIWEHYTEAMGNLLRTQLSSLQTDSSPATVQKVIDQIIDDMARYHDENPSFVEIRRCVEATPELRALNNQNTMEVAELVRNVLMTVNPGADEVAVADYALILIEAASSTVKVGQHLTAERREHLYTSLKIFLRGFLRSLSRARFSGS